MPSPDLLGPSSTATEKAGPLDGLTILRFAHAYETGGGVELHLRDLNRGLSLRNKLTTILVHLSKDHVPGSAHVESVGGSKLIKIALPTTRQANDGAPSDQHEKSEFLRKGLTRALNLALRTFALNRLFARFVSRWHRVPVRSNDALHAGPTAAELIARHRVDLVVLHTNGSADASAVIAAARTARVPVAAIHHFSNGRLGDLSVRQQMAGVETIAGASTVDLPAYVKRRFTNLSDAVDLEFFCVEHAKPVPFRFPAPVLFAPGRLMPDKGQMDALEVAAGLHRRGIRNTLVFAGRVDDPAFERALRQKAEAEGIADHVHFAGELTLPQYRDWFAAATLMLMPTRHHEGMPRTLIDSQAMRVPPIVYNIGGTPDGVRHGQTGFLVRLGELSSMTEHAAALLENNVLREQMAANGRAFVEAKFSLAAFLARHEHFYLEALSRARNRAVRH